MTIITKGMGAVKKLLTSKKAINYTTGKPFPKSIQDHMKAGDKRRAGMKKAGYKGPKHELYETKTKGKYKVHEVRKKELVKGSLGKKTYKSDWIKGHRAHQRMGLIKD